MTTPTFGAITIICFVVGAWLKAFAPAGSNKAIPAALMSLGGALGLAAFFLVPGFPADNFLDALAVGAVSGAASTGIHQIYRQAEKELRDEYIIDLGQASNGNASGFDHPPNKGNVDLDQTPIKKEGG